ncbi:Nn.00g106450.m01.CDS01 [Neocucurbitaria sp. VM-36]
MPKKHTPLYAQTKPSYVHPSLQSSRASSSSAPTEPQTVNQRIQQLRREQAPRATPEQRDEFTSVVSRTVPPELRRILHIPEVNAPKPKAGTRTRRVLGAARPPPGPAAPSSWLQHSRHAPAHMRRRKQAGIERAAPKFSTLARATDGEFKRLPPPRSLVHHCLRTFAIHWENLCEYEQHYIPTLPISLKEALLSYLTVFGAQGCLDFKSFKILFQNDEGTGTSGWDETRFLDLANLLNQHFTIGDVGKCLKRPNTTQAALDLGSLRISDPKPDTTKDTVIAGVADSWEDEAEETATIQPVLAATLQTPHFTNLSRLSLAKPGPWASWPELIRISPHLNKITHLSLAYWPRPSMTPNATTTSMVSNHSSVALGGSHFYSDLDDDWHEAANILRRFSINTYSLQWLDLEGCTWLKALTWRSVSLPTSPRPGGRQDSSETWQIHSLSPSPDWNDAWRRITYLNVFQGWIPCDNQSLQSMPAGVVPVQLMRWLRENKDKDDVRWRLNANETGHAVAEWVQREKMAKAVGMEIHGIRKSGEGVWCKVDYGWGSAAGERVSS